MPSPFPGMDPYLEDPELWSGFHAAFIAELQLQISPLVRPDYFVRIEERVYLAEEDDPGYRLIVPDARVVAAKISPTHVRPSASGLMIAEPIPVIENLEDEVHESRLEIRDRVDRSIVAIIELLSPTNKTAGAKGRASFLQKRRETLASPAHWMEIDLLRAGMRTTHVTPGSGTAYSVYLSRAGDPRKAYVWPMGLREPLKIVGLPLRGNHADVPIDLQTALNQVYLRGGYDLDFDYANDPLPPISPDDLQWVRERISQA